MARRKRGPPSKQDGNKHLDGTRRGKRRGEAGWFAELTEAEPTIRSLMDVARNTERHRDSSERSRRKHEHSLTFVHGGMLGDGHDRPSGSKESKQEGDAPSGWPGEEQQAGPAGEPRAESRGQGLIYTPRTVATQRQPNEPNDTGEQRTEEDGDEEETDIVLFTGRRTHSAQTQARSFPCSTQMGNTEKTQLAEWSRSFEGGTIRGEDCTSSSSPGRLARLQLRGKPEKLPLNFDGWKHPMSEEDMSSVTQSPMDDEALRDYITNIQAHASGDEVWMPGNPGNWALSDATKDGELPEEGPRSLIPKGATKHETLFRSPSSLADRKIIAAAEDAVSIASTDTLDQAARDLQTALDQLEGESASAEIDNVMESEKTYDPATADPWRTQEQKSKNSHDVAFVRGVGWTGNNAFDITDRSRRSIQGDRKSKHQKPILQLSDSELENALLASWETDKAKKRQRKKDRAEARAKGAFDRHTGTAAFAATQQDFDWDHLKDRLLNFTALDSASLTLPPMDKRSRRLVHEVANALNLRSKSTGSGERRFPTLYRTSQTPSITDALFADVRTRLSQRFHSVSSVPAGHRTGKLKTAARTSLAAASYRDGDVVGAEAPEIGVENRGRAMLEKMGWSSGTALGAINNKGILQPVSHIVKNSKLGLG